MNAGRENVTRPNSPVEARPVPGREHVCDVLTNPTHVEAGRGARAARAVESVVWRGEIRPVAVLQRLGLPDSCLRG